MGEIGSSEIGEKGIRVKCEWYGGVGKRVRRCRGGSFVESVTFAEGCHTAKGIFCVSRCGAGTH